MFHFVAHYFIFVIMCVMPLSHTVRYEDVRYVGLNITDLRQWYLDTLSIVDTPIMKDQVSYFVVQIDLVACACMTSLKFQMRQNVLAVQTRIPLEQ